MPSPQCQRNQAPKRALKHQCVFDFVFRRRLLAGRHCAKKRGRTKVPFFCRAPVTLCFAEKFRDPGSSPICFATPPPSPASELKLLASAIPIPFSSSFTPSLI